MIRLEAVTRRYGSHVAVSQLSFALARGELTGLLGPNGAGKTTTMRLITGVLAPHAGRVLLAGEEVTGASHKLRDRLGYLPENCPLYVDMTPLEMLETAGRLHGLGGSDLREAIGRVVAQCGLSQTPGRPMSGRSISGRPSSSP